MMIIKVVPIKEMFFITFTVKKQVILPFTENLTNQYIMYIKCYALHSLLTSVSQTFLGMDQHFSCYVYLGQSVVLHKLWKRFT